MTRSLCITTIGLLAVALLLVFASAALAANPHFLRGAATGPDGSGNLAVSFKIAGLGDAITTQVTATADATAVYACMNNGGNFPADPKKQEVSGPVSASGQFTSGKNGQIVGTLTLMPPATTLDCPPGQHCVLVSVTYTNVQIHEASAGTMSIPGIFSSVFYQL